MVVGVNILHILKTNHIQKKSLRRFRILQAVTEWQLNDRPGGKITPPPDHMRVNVLYVGENTAYFKVFYDEMDVFDVKYVKYVGEKDVYFNVIYNWY